MKCRAITENEIRDIVSVHIQCFKGYFLTGLGENLLCMYYQEFYNENPNLFLVAENDDNEIIGFVMGMLDESQARKNFEKNNKSLLFARLLKMCLRIDGNAWKRVAGRVRSKLSVRKDAISASELPGKFGSLLSIAVLPDFSGHGYGQDLVRSYENLLVRYGCEYCRLSVQLSNINAIKLYEKCGYEEYSRSVDGISYKRALVNI